MTQQTRISAGRSGFRKVNYVNCLRRSGAVDQTLMSRSEPGRRILFGVFAEDSGLISTRCMGAGAGAVTAARGAAAWGAAGALARPMAASKKARCAAAR